jgi:hypothetical protein
LIGTPYDRVRDLMQAVSTLGALKVDYVNSYLYYLVTTRILGLIVFLMFVFYPIYQLLVIRPRIRNRLAEMDAATALFSAQVALTSMVFGTSFFRAYSAVRRAADRHDQAADRAGAAILAGFHCHDGATRPIQLLVINPLRPTLLPEVR